jgi:lambda family phage portal protein
MSLWREMLGLPAKPEPARVKVRDYAAAQIGRLFADFRGGGASADSELLASLSQMRNRSRELERNDPYVRRYFDLMKVNVIGPNGMRLQVKARNDRAEGMDTFANRMIEEKWAEFCQRGNCTADGQMSMKALCDLVLAGALRDGEQFLQVVRGASFAHGIALHPFEPDMVDERKNERLSNGNRIRMGVEIDRYNRVAAYWVRELHPGDYQLSSAQYGETKRIAADDIIHVRLVRRAGQTRGEPVLAPVITALKQLNGYREAELVAARLGASKMGFFTSAAGDEFPYDATESGVPIMDAEPGTFHQLPNGVDFKAFDMSHPATAYGDFEKAVGRAISMGLGVSYESLFGNLEGVSYSSIRQGSISERDFFAMMQSWFAEQFLTEVFRYWLRHAMQFGIVNLPAAKFDKFFGAASFRGRGWQWVDPQKEIGASREAMHLGLSSMHSEAAARGEDIEDIFQQIQRDKELAASMGLELAFEPFGAPAGKKTEAMADNSGQDENQS